MSTRNYSMSLHKVFFDKIGHFSFDRRMENLPTSETLISSLQRQLGLTPNGSESEVWIGSDLYGQVFNSDRRDLIAKIFQNELSSPVSAKGVAEKQSTNSAYKYREYIKPVVPAVAGYVHSARPGLGAGSPWNPGRWLLEELTHGFDNLETYKAFVLKLANSLKVLDQDKHELALFLRNSTKPYDFEINEKLIEESWHNNNKRTQYDWNVSILHQRHVQLINYVIDVKNDYSRYRWFLFLDAVLRLFSTISSLWRLKQPSHFISCLEDDILFHCDSMSKEIVRYGETRITIVKGGIQDYIIKYLQIFHICQNLGINASKISTNSLFSLISLRATPSLLRECELSALQTIRSYKSEFDFNASSTLKNVKEFLEYVGIQKPDYSFKTVDYTYHYQKEGRDYKFAFSDALLVILVKYINSLKSIEFTSVDFVENLAGLGVKIDYSHFSMGTLGKSLHRLGLVEELSDSDSGMIFRAI